MAYCKRDAIRIVSSAAKEYQKKLEGTNLLFIYRDRKTNQIEFFEAIFLANNFQHLSGIEMIDSDGNRVQSATLFYQKCLDGKLKEEEIRFKDDGTTELKLNALPYVVSFIDKSKITGLFNGKGLTLEIDRLVGTVTYCLGFIQDGEYFYPGSCLLSDFCNLVDVPSQVLAIFSKSVEEKEPLYKNIRYLAKGFPIEKVNFPEKLRDKITIENKMAYDQDDNKNG